jgi:hypothetical protein
VSAVRFRPQPDPVFIGKTREKTAVFCDAQKTSEMKEVSVFGGQGVMQRHAIFGRFCAAFGRWRVFIARLTK